MLRAWAPILPQSGCARKQWAAGTALLKRVAGHRIMLCMSGHDRDLVFAALGDGYRRLLLDRLRRRNGQTLSGLAEGLDITRQAVTKHLKTLEQAGLVTTRHRGREKLHFLNPVPIDAVALRWLQQFGNLPLEAFVPREE